MMPVVHPATGQTDVFVYGVSAGLLDWSGGARIGFTACVSTTWQSDSLVSCRTANGVGLHQSAAASVLLNRASFSKQLSHLAARYTRYVRFQVASANAPGTAISHIAVYTADDSLVSPSKPVSSSCGSCGNPTAPSAIVSGAPGTRAFPDVWLSSDTGPDWIQIDLGASYAVARVVVYGRGDCCWQRMQGASIALKDEIGDVAETRVLNADLVQVLTFASSGLNISVAAAVALPMSGALLVSANGMQFGSFRASLSAKFGATASECTSWQSSSSFISKSSGGIGLMAPVAFGLTVARINSLLPRTISLLWFQNVSASDWRKFSNAPSTGASSLLLVGRNLGGGMRSGVFARFTASACQSTEWLSDSCVRLRVGSGSVIVNSLLSVSFASIQSAKAVGALTFVASYNTPTLAAATSRLLRNIQVTGSNFGPFLAVVARTTRCSAATSVPQASSSLVCSSSDLDIPAAGGISIAEAAVSLSFADAARLDDVVVSLRSPAGAEYVSHAFFA